MRRSIAFYLAAVSLWAQQITQTPNVGLQIPAVNTPNWQVSMNYNFKLIDGLFGSNSVSYLGPPVGLINGVNKVYTFATAPAQIILLLDGLIMTPGIDYSYAAGTVTFLVLAPSAGDSIQGFGAVTGQNTLTLLGITGTIDGSNNTFTLSALPGNLFLAKDGVLMLSGSDYTLAGTVITFATPAIPRVGDALLAYGSQASVAIKQGAAGQFAVYPGVGTTLAPHTIVTQDLPTTGTGTKAATANGPGLPNDCVIWDSAGNVADSGAPCPSIPNTYLVNSPDFAWARLPSGALTASVSHTATLVTCPLGVNGSDANLHAYIADGTSGNETVAITGGTCTSGAPIGTIVFTPTLSHATGQWTIGSTTSGIYEAVLANPGAMVKVPRGNYSIKSCMLFPRSITQTGLRIEGETSAGTVLDFSGLPACDAFAITGPPTNLPILFSHFKMKGANSVTSTANGFHLTDTVRVFYDDLWIENFGANGILADGTSPGSFEIHIKDTTISANGIWGLRENQLTNLTDIRDSYITSNCRSTAVCGNLDAIGSGTASSTLSVQNTDLSNAGVFPFGGVTFTTIYGALIEDVTSILFTGNYVEGTTASTFGAAVFYSSASNPTGSISEIGNWFNGGTVVYGTTVTGVTSNSNTFSGSTTARVFDNTNFSTYFIGPDFCLASSPECTNHPALWSGGIATKPTSTDPGCAATKDGGKPWLDNTTSTWAYKICKSVSGTMGWSVVTTTP